MVKLKLQMSQASCTCTNQSTESLRPLYVSEGFIRSGVCLVERQMWQCAVDSCRAERNRGAGALIVPVIALPVQKSCSCSCALVHRSQSQRECSPAVVTQPTPEVGAAAAIYRFYNQLALLYLMLEQLGLPGDVLPVGSQKLIIFWQTNYININQVIFHFKTNMCFPNN